MATSTACTVNQRSASIIGENVPFKSFLAKLFSFSCAAYARTHCKARVSVLRDMKSGLRVSEAQHVHAPQANVGGLHAEMLDLTYLNSDSISM